MQPFLDFSLPIAGRSPRSRHASRSGSVRAAVDRPLLSRQYLELLRATGPRSDFEMAAALARPLSSICSTRNGLKDLIVASEEYEETPWRTKRTRWQVAK